jgi:hypothetical protein
VYCFGVKGFKSQSLPFFTLLFVFYFSPFFWSAAFHYNATIDDEASLDAPDTLILSRCSHPALFTFTSLWKTQSVRLTCFLVNAVFYYVQTLHVVNQAATSTLTVISLGVSTSTAWILPGVVIPLRGTFASYATVVVLERYLKKNVYTVTTKNSTQDLFI